MKKVPGPFRKFVEAYPECGMTYEALALASREAAGFPEKEAELVKLALAMGSRLEGAVHSHARRALEAGATAAEVRGVALLGLTTLGLPHAMMGTSWIEDVLRDAGEGRREGGEEGEEGEEEVSLPRRGSGPGRRRGPPSPLAGRVAEVVLRLVAASLPRDVVDGLEKRLELLLADRRREADPHPARLLADVPLVEPVPDRSGVRLVDVEEEVPVRPRAHAAGAHLDSEEVVQERRGEVVVQVAEDDRQDAEPFRVEIPEDDEVVSASPAPGGRARGSRVRSARYAARRRPA